MTLYRLSTLVASPGPLNASPIIAIGIGGLKLEAPLGSLEVVDVEGIVVCMN